MADGQWNMAWADAHDFNTAEKAHTAGRTKTNTPFRVLAHFPFTGCSLPIAYSSLAKGATSPQNHTNRI